jgi:hypothetical protein
VGNKRSETSSPDGWFLTIRDTLPDSAEATVELGELLATPPPGHHIWSALLQRSDRGRRCQIEVQYRRDKNNPPG